MNDVTFKKAEESDIDVLLGIYNYYVLNTTANFYHHAISKEEFRQLIFFGHDKYQTHLINCGNEFVGFCFLTQYKKREAYNRTAEIGIYLKPEFIGKGLGKSIVVFFEETAVRSQIGVILASISGENTASIKLVEKMGYEKCAHYREIGEKFGRLLDVVDYQKILRNRS